MGKCGFLRSIPPLPRKLRRGKLGLRRFVLLQSNCVGLTTLIEGFFLVGWLFVHGYAELASKIVAVRIDTPVGRSMT